MNRAPSLISMVRETVCIRGVYDSVVGAGTPILTRLTQWKIVPKRAVDLAFDVKALLRPLKFCQ